MWNLFAEVVLTLQDNTLLLGTNQQQKVTVRSCSKCLNFLLYLLSLTSAYNENLIAKVSNQPLCFRTSVEWLHALYIDKLCCPSPQRIHSLHYCVRMINLHAVHIKRYYFRTLFLRLFIIPWNLLLSLKNSQKLLILPEHYIFSSAICKSFDRF
jgi:hypothetical protein